MKIKKLANKKFYNPSNELCNMNFSRCPSNLFLILKLDVSRKDFEFLIKNIFNNAFNICVSQFIIVMNSWI